MSKLLDKGIIDTLRRGKQIRHGVKLLIGHIDALQKQIDGGKINVSVGIMNAEVDAGEDKVFGTRDDTVKLSLKKKKAPAKKKNKAPAKGKK
tara:strand:+ start:13 stop:288 length:276 start_codon:yes stop_codon:yes gene_type:complete